MKSNPFFLMILCAALMMASPFAHADRLDMPAAVSDSGVKSELPQPYVVKKGDTLWDIANYFFKEPMKWMKIWERNLYITNPDLIYPGNEIWFDGSKIKVGGLTTVRPQPKVVIKPVERLEGILDSSISLAALKRQDFINPNEVEGIGYLLDSQDERINFGVNDRVYIKLNQPAEVGQLFDVFRTTKMISDPNSGEPVGALIEHLGQLKAGTQSDGIYRAEVVKAFEEISRGDRLKPAKMINPRITPTTLAHPASGSVLYIRNGAHEAGQNQVVGISLGLKDGMKAGVMMSLYKGGRVVTDRVTDKAVKLPREKIGDVIVLVPQERASIAMVTRSTEAVNIGDTVASNGKP